ncbi:MAG TPA: hypothetical protein PKD91_05880 [Bacteroidia bacterium]|nr:hypothetical protein [Bacteroidia bacterium]
MARFLPYYPKIDSKGHVVVTYEIVTGTELLKDPLAQMDREIKIDPKKNYRRAVVVSEDHFFKLKKVYEEKGEDGVREYCELVKKYHAERSNKTETK